MVLTQDKVLSDANRESLKIQETWRLHKENKILTQINTSGKPNKWGIARQGANTDDISGDEVKDRAEQRIHKLPKTQPWLVGYKINFTTQHSKSPREILPNTVAGNSRVFCG